MKGDCDEWALGVRQRARDRGMHWSPKWNVREVATADSPLAPDSYRGAAMPPHKLLSVGEVYSA
ncbi:MAG: hypothetical protein HOP30_02490 [Cyclobacteriaceae bacterium]|nr:hypothetical protein [Cyclobacteriaceae bacterium]